MFDLVVLTVAERRFPWRPAGLGPGAASVGDGASSAAAPWFLMFDLVVLIEEPAGGGVSNPPIGPPAATVTGWGASSMLRGFSPIWRSCALRGGSASKRCSFSDLSPPALFGPAPKAHDRTMGDRVIGERRRALVLASAQG
jgi:hypothetical protein